MKKSDLKIGSVYRHIETGKRYVIVEVANEYSEKWHVMVVYVDDERKVWARTINEFLKKFEVWPQMISEV